MLSQRLRPIIYLLLALTPFIFSGCGRNAQQAEQQAKPAIPAKSGSETPSPPIDLDKVKPNELGQVLILEYHDVSDKEGRWSRHYNNFKSDLQRLYQAGYRPISLRDFVQNKIDVPAGMTPVVLTFDDGTAGQFRYLTGPNGPTVDPNCAVGVLEAFHAEHPDWRLEATFYVYYPNPFRQPEHLERKLRHIIALGMDIGNHTYSHVNLKKLTSNEAEKEMALAVKTARQHAPDARVDSIALPYGLGPVDPAILRSGEQDGQRYENIAALLVGAEPAPSPADVSFDAYRLPRVQAIQTELDKWLAYFEKHPEKQYVSDGDPSAITFPRELEDRLNKIGVGDRQVRTY